MGLFDRVDDAVVAAREGARASLNEMFVLGAQIVHGAASAVLSLVHAQHARAQARTRIRDDSRSAYAETRVGAALSPSPSVSDMVRLVAAMEKPGGGGAAAAAGVAGAAPAPVAVAAEIGAARQQRPPQCAHLLRQCVHLVVVTLFFVLRLALAILPRPPRVFRRAGDAAAAPPSSTERMPVPGRGSANAAGSGLFQDARIAAMMVMDKTFYGFQTGIRELRSNPLRLPSKLIRWWARTLVSVAAFLARGLWNPLALLSSAGDSLGGKDNPDRVSIESVIRESGYPYEEHIVSTNDGYVLVLDRIPRKGSSSVVLMIHGLLDNAFAWVGGGSRHSLAFRAFDEGSDVWLANLRGTRNGRQRVQMARRVFWNFNINHHALLDIPAIVNKIVAITKEEFLVANAYYSGDDHVDARFPRRAHLEHLMKPTRINIISHSMGAAATIMYMIAARLRGEDHFVSRAFLLSPAGVHKTVPKIARVLGPPLYLMTKLLGRFFVVLAFPSEAVRIIVQKLVQDVRSMSSTRDLVALLISGLIVGRAAELDAFPFATVPNLAYNLFSGTSVGVLHHVFQWYWAAGRFLAFDYGAKGNQEAYGQAVPPNFLDYYECLDVPMHFISGTGDRLIAPENVAIHHKTLAAVHPELAHLASFQMGHIDFTYGVAEPLVKYLLAELPRDEGVLKRSTSLTLFDALSRRQERHAARSRSDADGAQHATGAAEVQQAPGTDAVDVASPLSALVQRTSPPRASAARCLHTASAPFHPAPLSVLESGGSRDDGGGSSGGDDAAVVCDDVSPAAHRRPAGESSEHGTDDC